MRRQAQIHLRGSAQDFQVHAVLGELAAATPCRSRKDSTHAGARLQAAWSNFLVESKGECKAGPHRRARARTALAISLMKESWWLRDASMARRSRAPLS